MNLRQILRRPTSGGRWMGIEGFALGALLTASSPPPLQDALLLLGGVVLLISAVAWLVTSVSNSRP